MRLLGPQPLPPPWAGGIGSGLGAAPGLAGLQILAKARQRGIVPPKESTVVAGSTATACRCTAHEDVGPGGRVDLLSVEREARPPRVDEVELLVAGVAGLVVGLDDVLSGLRGRVGVAPEGP